MDFSSPALPPNVTPLTDGDPLQVGRHRLIGRLGADGLGTLYAAVSPDHEAMALKIADAEWAEGADTADEVALMRQAGGVCTVPVRDSGTYEGRPWSAVGFIPGFELWRRMRAHGPFSGDQLLVLAAGIAEALAGFHSMDLVHGDMRPGNVVVAAGGPKVLDYGITRRIDPSAPTQSAQSLGWLAPERYERGAASAATDVHGWAGLVVYAATGIPPFGPNPAGHVPGRVPGQIVWEMAARAREARVDLSALPEELRPLLERAFSPDPARRPSAEEAYLECLLLLGIDERATADTWSDRLRALIVEHWPDLDIPPHDPVTWTDAALALAERERGEQPTGAAAAGPVPPMPSARPRESAAPVHGPVPGLPGSGTAGMRPGSDASDYLFGGRGATGSENESQEMGIEEDDETAGGPRVGLWLVVGAVGMALALGIGYLLYETLSDSPADTVVAEKPDEGSAGSTAQEEEPAPEPATPESMACDDTERVSAQEDRAQWRPFDPQAAAAESYLDLLTPGPEGAAIVDPEIWPFVYPVDHDTVDYGLATPGLSAFPVLTVCMTEVVPAADGVEFSVELRYHPNVGSHNVYAEDFMALVPLDPAENAGVDKRIHRGGTGSELEAPLTALTVLGPDHPSEQLTVYVPGAPERAGVAYRPAAHSGPLVHEMSGHCYDVDGTLEWRDEETLGSGFFAVPDTSMESNTMMDCPVDEGDTSTEGDTADENGTGGEGDAGGEGGAVGEGDAGGEGATGGESATGGEG